MARPHVSVVVPVFNETTRLITGFLAITTYLLKQSYSWECIIVDDGSTVPAEQVLFGHKKTKRLIRRLVQEKKCFLIRLPVNTGKGAALAEGFFQAQGAHIFFSDVDLSVPIDVIPQFLVALKTNDVAIASRRMPSSKILTHQSFFRESAGRIYTFLSNAVMGVRVHDATCGFKAFRRDVGKHLFRQRKINRWAFDTEILFLVRRFKYSMIEIPVSWKHKTGSKVTFFDAIYSAYDLLRICWFRVLHMYPL